MKSYNYIPTQTKIIAKKWLNPDTCVFRIRRPRSFNFLSGQFVMLSVSGFGEIPIGIASSPNEKKYLEVAIRAAGGVSKKICSLITGEELGLNGPFGNGFPMAKMKGRDVVLITGGIGLFPLRSLILFLGEQKYAKSLTILNGARVPENLYFSEEYESWSKFSKILATVDKAGKDWKGSVGNVTCLFDKAKVKTGSVLIVCGPPAMYQAVVDRFAGKRIAESDLYFDLERRMKCGIGKCQHCTCGKAYTCTDGPTFSYSELKYNKEAFE